MDDMYYFGCVGCSGHFLHKNIDGQLGSQSCRHELYSLKPHIDGGYTPKGNIPEGYAHISYVKTGDVLWSIFSFNDYSVDHRPGSHSTFIFKNKHCYTEMARMIKEAFQMIVKRFDFEIRPIEAWNTRTHNRG